MSAIETYLDELARALKVRGAPRRRFLRESRDHLLDAAGERGEREAVRTFGPPSEVAAAFDAEVATHRGLRATSATTAAVLAVGGSTLVLIQAAAPGATAPTAWAIVFFIAAQIAGVAGALAVVQALAHRRETLEPADAALLVRRNACALVAAALTMFAAGAAVPGSASAILLLAGPALACVAAVGVLRARSLARRLDGSKAHVARPPLADLRQLTGLPVPALDPLRLLALTTCAAAAAAFARDLLERATLGGALVTAAIEAVAVLGGFAVLGRALGLTAGREVRARSG
ncbi:MAG TPA: hypothetical protein VI300_22755 [Solirubrobacter sp.]